MTASKSLERQLEKASRLALNEDWPGARRHCASALNIAPDDPEALRLMGVVLCCLGNLDAAAYLRKAIRSRPSCAMWRRELGIVLLRAGKWSAAAASLARSLDLDPNDESSLELYAHALSELKNFEKALGVYESWGRVAQDSSKPLFGQAQCLVHLDRLAEARDHASLGLEIDPDSTDGHRLLAGIHYQLQENDRELSHRLEVLRLAPQDVSAITLAAVAHYRVGEIESALTLFRSVLANAELSSDMHSAFLVVLLHHAGVPAQTLIQEHSAWARCHAPVPPHKQDFRNPRASARKRARRKLRIGYISGEPVGSPGYYVLTPLFRNHDRGKFDIALYSVDRSIEGSADYLHLAPRELRAMVDWPPDKIAKRIRDDQVDILVDVSGHYGGHALLVSAARAAPIQVSFPNYPFTTGLPSIDYIFTDEWTCLSGQEQQYTEQPYGLDSGYLVYDPPEWAPPMARLPARRVKRVTFGLFQRPPKLNAEMWDAIAEVLRRVKGSRLLVHYAAPDLDVEGSLARRRVISSLERKRIAPDRVEFCGKRGLERHLEVVSSVDIALDSFPYSGQTTTFESLWMGVPVVTLAGETHASRVSAGLLLRAGLQDYVATTTGEYIEAAVRAASDLPALDRLRKGMRRQVKKSGLLDGARLTVAVENAYRAIWRRWVDS